jgi:hypothetical protein
VHCRILFPISFSYKSLIVIRFFQLSCELVLISYWMLFLWLVNLLWIAQLKVSAPNYHKSHQIHNLRITRFYLIGLMSNFGMCKWYIFQGIHEQVWRCQCLLVHMENGRFFVSDFEDLVEVFWEVTPCILVSVESDTC